jgi:hypothetical protein
MKLLHKVIGDRLIGEEGKRGIGDIKMSDAGEGLVDAESRLAERIEEREENRRRARQATSAADLERARQLESLRLARTEMQRQLELATHDARKQQLRQAVEEIDRRIQELSVS